MAIITAPVQLSDPNTHQPAGKWRLCRYSDEDNAVFTAGCQHEHATPGEASNCAEACAAFDRRTDYYEANAAGIRLDQRFTYKRANPGQSTRYNEIVAAARSFAALLMRNCPPGRETACAITHIEESVMWAIAAIARNE